VAVRREVDATHDPQLTSFVESANGPKTDFPIQNLPLGVFVPPSGGEPRIGTAIGDRILDLRALAQLELLPAALRDVCAAPQLNALMAAGADRSRALRARLSELLRAGESELQDSLKALHAAEDSRMLMPALIGDYTDFYASVHHATNVGSMFRPDNPLLPNYKWIPVGYHGRASTVVLSGTQIRRPCGQLMAEGAGSPSFAACGLLDYELEVGFFVGAGNEMGSRVSLEDAESHLFGICLVNDWSARDIQKWEYQPLGPFLAKNFATTLSPWVVTMEALAPFRVPAFERDAADPTPLPHLLDADDQAAGGVDLTLEVLLASAQMREQGIDPMRLSQGSFAQMYWTMAQMFTHHASSGCRMQPGDLMASGTVSGSTKESRGSMLELSWRGTEPIRLPTGEERKFLADGDEVILRGWCERDGAVRIGLGECSGVVLPAAED